MSKRESKKITFIDLFAGTGAFSYVLEKCNFEYDFECVFANDIAKESKMIYDLNHSVSLTQKDLNDIKAEEIPKHDILCGGFPCQPFSIAGEQKGFNDPRSNVFWKIIEILNYHKPKIIILENVKNLKTHDKGNTLKIIKENLIKLGYELKINILDTSKITSIPQHRERIYIVGFLSCSKKFDLNFDFNFDFNFDLNFDFNFDCIPKQNIINFLEKKVDKKFYYTEKLKVYETIKECVNKHISTNTIYQYRRYYVRECKNGCCPTLTANMGLGGHNVPILKDDIGIRKLTPKECFSLQGFPDDYKLPKISNSLLYKLAGNAVSIPVVELIVKKIFLFENR